MENTLALLLILDVLALVLAAIGPSEESVAVHFVVLPCSFELTTISPIVHTYITEARKDQNLSVRTRDLP